MSFSRSLAAAALVACALVGGCATRSLVALPLDARDPDAGPTHDLAGYFSSTCIAAALDRVAAIDMLTERGSIAAPVGPDIEDIDPDRPEFRVVRAAASDGIVQISQFPNEDVWCAVTTFAGDPDEIERAVHEALDRFVDEGFGTVDWDAIGDRYAPDDALISTAIVRGITGDTLSVSLTRPVANGDLEPSYAVSALVLPRRCSAPGGVEPVTLPTEV